jgi:hypothetical protein
MKEMPLPGEPLDLIDLKFLPAWVKEDWSSSRHGTFEEEEQAPWPRRDRDRSARPSRHRRDEEKNRRRHDRGERDNRGARDHKEQKRSRDLAPRRDTAAPIILPQLDVHFLPQAAALENVAAQIKTGIAAYSVYALARLFLQKPERYHVKVKAKNAIPLFRLGESGAIATNRLFLENSAFRLLRAGFYTINVTLNDPVKGDFNSVARERTTGIVLGPTNYHGYQPQLRRLYEQRFSRRMSFTDFQRQIEIVSDPALIEQWKEDVRKVTTFRTQEEDPAQSFNSEAEAERHFRERYLPKLVSETTEAEIDGVTSRKLSDRGIARLIENLWSAEVRSPSNMMQELAGRFRGAGLQIFRHRKGMLFVSPIRLRPIDENAVSHSVRQILQTLKASPRLNRKELAEKLIGPDVEASEAEKMKLALASELHWLIREGHIIEFNDGSLDLPRAKSPKKAPTPPTTAPSIVAVSTSDVAATIQSGSEESESSVDSAVSNGTEVLPPLPSPEDQESHDFVPRTAAATEAGKIAPTATRPAVSATEESSTEAGPTDLNNDSGSAD